MFLCHAFVSSSRGTFPPSEKETASQQPTKPRVPPPPSAKVSEALLRQCIEENKRREQRPAWEAWEKAQKKYIKEKQELEERNEPKTAEAMVTQNATGAGNKEQPQAQVTVPVEQKEISPLTPLIPGEETPVEDGSTTEEHDGEEDQRNASALF